MLKHSENANIQEAFVSKLTDVEGEAAETQVWLDYSLECGYIVAKTHAELFDNYDHIIALLVNMSTKPENWSFNDETSLPHSFAFSTFRSLEL